MSVEAAPPPANSKAHAEWLRLQAHDHPVVQELMARLPAFRGPAERHEPGIYVDAIEAPSISVRRELRVSLMRIFSANGQDIQLVGQVQAVTSPSDPKLWALRFYVHAPTQFLTREIHHHDTWWIGMLERHYARGGAPVSVFEQITL